MKLLFPVSTLSILRTELRKNPTASSVEITHAEFVDIVSELLENGDSNAVLIGNKSNRIFTLDGRCISVKIV